MRDTLYIRLGADAPTIPASGTGAHADVSWRAPSTTSAPGDEPGPVRQGALAEAAASAAGCRVVALVPGEAVLFARTRIPTTQRQRMLRAVPFALEEQLAEDVERLHFALGAQDPERGVAVAVTAREHMDHWLEALSAAGIHADALVPDTLMLPWEPGTWTGLVERHRAILRTGAQDGLAADPDNLAEVLALALAEAGAAREDTPAQTDPDGDAPAGAPDAPDPARPERIRLFLDAGLEPPAGLDALPVAVAVEEAPAGLLGLLPAGTESGRRGIDLLQGQYSRREQVGRLWRPWRATAALLGAWMLVGTGLQIYQYVDLRARIAAGAQAVVQLYRRTFPDERRVVNARVQMEHHLQALRQREGVATGGFLALLAKAGAALEQAPGVILQGVDYRDGGLDLRVAAKSVGGLDRLRSALSSGGGLTVDLQSASTHEGRVESRLRIRSRGS